MHKPTVEPHLSYWVWQPEKHDNWNSFWWPSAAYDTLNHRLLIPKLFNITQDSTLWSVIQNLLLNMRLYMGLTTNEADGDYKRMACHKGVFSAQICTPFNIYTNNQPVHDGKRSFICADDLCIAAQLQIFSQVENTIEETLGKLTEYYKTPFCVRILTKRVSPRFISGTERQRDH